MNRTLRLALTASILAASICGCASTGQRAPRGKPPRYDLTPAAGPAQTVEIGMSKTDVRRLWGVPRDVSAKQGAPGTEVWTYEFKKAMAGAQGGTGARAVVQRIIYRLTFSEGTVTHIESVTY